MNAFSWIPASVTKRLIHYALSKYDILETDALDLANLDVAIGRSNSFEFRAVKLKQSKLTELLRLPEHIRLESAHVALLRLRITFATVPVITIDVEGPELKARLEDPAPSKPVPGRGVPRKSQFKEGLHSDAEEDVPTTVIDLAASFLAHEPRQEKEALQARALAQSADLQQSSWSSSADEDTGPGVGVDSGLTGLVGTYVKAIVDRLQINIRDVAVQAKLDVPIPGSSDPQGATDTVVLVSRIGQVKLLDTKAPSQSAADPEEVSNMTNPSSESGTSHVVQHAGKTILLQNVQGSLLTHKDLLSRMGPLPEGSIPVKDPSSPAQSWAKTASPSPSSHSPAQTFRSAASLSQSRRSPGFMGQSADSISGSFQDPQEHISWSSEDVLSGEQFQNDYGSTYKSSLSQREDETLRSQYFDEEHDDDNDDDERNMYAANQFPGDIENSLRLFREERQPADSSIYYSRGSMPISLRSGSRTPSPPPDQQVAQRSYADGARTPSPSIPFHSSMLSSPAFQESPPLQEPEAEPENMTTSTMYSHEDARSIYMSVLDERDSHTQAAEKAESSHYHMPGGWSDTSLTDSALREVEPPQKQVPDKGSEAAASHREVEDVSATKESNILPDTDGKISQDHVMTSLFSIDRTEVNIPYEESRHESTGRGPSTGTEIANSTLLQSSSTATPGSFSAYASSTARRRVNLSGSRARESETSSKSKSSNESAEGLSRHFNLSMGNVTCRLNITTSRLLLQIARRLQALFSTDESTYKVEHRQAKASAESPLRLSFSFFLKSLIAEVADVGSSQFSKGRNVAYHGGDEKSLVAIKLDDTHFQFRGDGNLQSSEASLGTLLIDIAGERVISFSKDAPLTESTRDAKATKDDIFLSIETSKAYPSTALSLLTMPLRVDLDFHRIDDTLSSFGGFSGLIELGNSILSESDVISPSPPPSAPERPRAVRFETNAKPPGELPSDPDGFKVSCRIRGTDVMLRGKATTIRYQSTPIKAILRNGAVVVQVDVMKITAPYTGPRSEPDLEVNVSNMRFHYLVHPDERDLSRLISLLTPSNDKFEKDDDLLLDMLIRQRKKGAGSRIGADDIQVSVAKLEVLQSLQEFGVELTKLSVAKYLPEESRPGMLTLGSIKSIRLNASCVPKLGSLDAVLLSTEFAHIGAPSLLAITVQSLKVSERKGDSLIHKVVPNHFETQPPMIMARLIDDELESTLKIKLWNVAAEYSAILAETLMGYQPGQEHDLATDLTASIATLTDKPSLPKADTFTSEDSQESQNQRKPLLISVALRDCAIGLTPRAQPAKALFVLTQAHLETTTPQNSSLDMRLQLQKANLYLIDDVKKLVNPRHLDHDQLMGGSLSPGQICDIDNLGYVSVFWLQAMTVTIQLQKSENEDPDVLDIEASDGLMVMETCADSQKTLTDVLGALSPTMPPAKGKKYQTEIAPLQDMLASFTGDAFTMREENFQDVAMDDSQLSFDDAQDLGAVADDEDLSADFDNIGGLPGFIGQSTDSQVLEDSIASNGSPPITLPQRHEVPPQLGSSQASFRSEIIVGDMKPTVMPPKIHGFAKKWDSSNNRYVHLTASELGKSPVRVKVRGNHVIWNLHDGYDWEKTREVISKAVYEVQSKAEERRSSRRAGLEEDDKQPVIEDFLFNSIYIGVDVANSDPKDLRDQINRNVDELMTETGSHTSTTVTNRPASVSRPLRPHGKKLRLKRSKRHKITFELKGIDVDIFLFQPGGETQSSIDVRVHDFEIFDHVPTSTWKKFATYMHDAGPREDKKPMLHLELCDVRPVPTLIASELVLRVTVLPVRLHVDQDALDFLTRFFEFKDEDSSAPSAPPDQPYLQRVEVRPVPVKLDFKPKRIDYAGLRSGRTSEFKNIFVLDGAAFVLKHVIIYGVSGFLKLHHSLEDIWMPDVTRNQLPTVLSGLGGVRTLVNVGSGVRDLVMIPVQEYQKDGRVVRSIAKGMSAFGRTTGGELTRFGAKLAVGAQTYLQGAEDMLTGGSKSRDGDWTDADLEEEEKRVISNYADQPAGILQGLKGAAKSLERDLLIAKDVIIAISGEVGQADTAEGAARAIARNAPTLILRPMIGATKAIGQTLMGATNTVDPQNKKRIEDKYKHH